jgi:hypothetical protein
LNHIKLESKYLRELDLLRDQKIEPIKKHIKADNIICDLLNELGFKRIINVYKNI